MMQYSYTEWNYNLKRRRELHECKDSPVKSIISVPVYVMVFSSLFICSNNNKRLDKVISNSGPRIINVSCPDIGFNNKILDAEVNNNVLLKLEERQNVERCKYDDLSFLSSSENTSNKSGRISGSRNKSKCERLTKIIMNCGSPNS